MTRDLALQLELEEAGRFSHAPRLTKQTVISSRRRGPIDFDACRLQRDCVSSSSYPLFSFFARSTTCRATTEKKKQQQPSAFLPAHALDSVENYYKFSLFLRLASLRNEQEREREKTAIESSPAVHIITGRPYPSLRMDTRARLVKFPLEW